MLKAHELVQCKCAREMIDGTCEGCGLIYEDCDCETLEDLDDLSQKEK